MSSDVEVAWLSPQVLGLTGLLLDSHRRLFDRPLLRSKGIRLAAQELFVLDQVVLCHDGSEDPCFLYANRAALHDAGGIRAILKAMREHREARKVQHQACRVLWNATVHSAHNRAAVAKFAGADDLRIAQTTFPLDTELCKCAAGALRELGF